MSNEDPPPYSEMAPPDQQSLSGNSELGVPPALPPRSQNETASSAANLNAVPPPPTRPPNPPSRPSAYPNEKANMSLQGQSSGPTPGPPSGPPPGHNSTGSSSSYNPPTGPPPSSNYKPEKKNHYAHHTVQSQIIRPQDQYHHPNQPPYMHQETGYSSGYHQPPPQQMGRPQLHYPPGYRCPRCNNTGIKQDKGTTCKDCFERFGVRTQAQHLPYGVQPVFSLPPRVVQPGDPSIGGWLCGRCRGSGVIHDLMIFESQCPVCRGVGRVF